MIITQKKPMEELMAMVGDAKTVAIVGCNSCATACHTGGEPEVAALPQRSGVRTICFSKKPACMAAHASCLCLPVLYHVGFLFASLGIL